MIQITSMADFDEYIRSLANGENTEEDVSVEATFNEMWMETSDEVEVYSKMLMQLFDGLDYWRREGNLTDWYGTSFVLSVLSYIGRPVQHGKLLGAGVVSVDIDEGGW